MKMQTYKWLVTITLVLLHQIAYSQLKVGDNPANITKSAVLELQSANQGLLLSRIADTTLVSNPPDGMVIYYIPAKQVLIRSNGGWKAIVDNTAASAAYVDLTSTQTISGAKTFSNNVILTGTSTGSVSDSVLTINGGIVKKLPFSSVSPIPATRTISTTAPLSGGGDLSANRTLAIADAVADGATKGAATFAAADFNAAGGVVSIDYINGTTANTTTKGFLNATDWNTFNNKLSTARNINTTAPLAGGGDLSADRTITIANAAADGLTKGAASFATNDFDATSGNVAIDYTNGQAATSLVKGFLTAADWTTFNNKLATTRTISTTAPLTGGGDLSANRTLAITDAVADGLTKGAATFTASDFNTTAGNVSIDYTNGTTANTTTKGFLTAADWNTFNNKLSTVRNINTTAPLAGGGDLTADRTITIANAAADGLTKGAASFATNDFDATAGNVAIDYTNGQTATTAVKGFLTAADWTTFNNKLSTVDTGNIANFSVKVRSLFSGTAPVTYSNGVFSMAQANTTTNGYLSSTDWNTFNNKLSTVRNINTTAPLAGGGDLSADRTITIANAAADGLTKGAASFATNDFDATAGNVAIDYTNGQAATSLVKGFLTAADWTTFNNKLSTTRTISTTAPLTGGGDLSANRTLAITDAVADGVTKGAATYNATDFDASAGVISIDYTNGRAATTSSKGFLTSADWNTFNNKLGTVDTTNIANFSVKVRSLFSGTAPVTYSNGVFSMAQANTTTNGYLSSTDWNTFNSKLTTVDTTNIANFYAKVRSLFSATAPVTYSNGVFSMAQANTTTNGYLSSTDWNTFNNKLSTVRNINTTAPLAGGGDLSADRTITISNAAADGLTKGAASFVANDFDATAGNVAIDYTNGQAATSLVKGFLTAADWTTFNNKLSTTRTISTTAPLSGGGDLSANRTISIANAQSDGVTKGAASFTGADFIATAGNISINYSLAQAASTTLKGFLTAADWNTFNNKASTSTVWGLTGNAGTVTATTFLGTTDAKDLRIRTNNVERMVVDGSTGTIAIGTAVSASDQLNVSATNALNAVAGIATDGFGLNGTSTNNFGVYGTSTNSHGIYGNTDAPDASGVRGYAAQSGPGVSGESVQGVGVYGIGNGPSGTGVYGESVHTGVYGVTTGGALTKGVAGVAITNGIGVSGSSASASGVMGVSTSGPGVSGSSNSSYGVYGSTAGANTHAIYGYTTGSNSNAVYGTATTGRGIYGVSTSNSGAEGISTSGNGVFGSSNSGSGVYGTTSGNSTNAVTGYTIATSANGVSGSAASGAGVIGTSTSGYGVTGTSTTQDGVSGFSGSGFGVSGSSYSNAGVYGVSSFHVGIYGVTSAASSNAIWGNTGALNSNGVYGSSQTGHGISGNTNSGNGVNGVSVTGIGVNGVSTSGVGVSGSSSSTYGISGASSSNFSSAIYGNGTGTSTNGVYGNSSTGHGIVGVSNATAKVAIYALNTNATGTGIVGLGNNLSIGLSHIDAAGSGGFFEGSKYGVYAYASATANGTASIKTYNAATAGNVFVNYKSDGTFGTAGTNYKIHGVGTVGTVVKDLDNNYVSMHAPETPEILFEDYGTGRLENGKMHIDLDPIFAKNVTVNEKHPLRVFIQVEGECNGVYVTNKTAKGFDVAELKSGKSNISFQYHIVGNRADEIDNNGGVSSNADVRFDSFIAPQQK